MVFNFDQASKAESRILQWPSVIPLGKPRLNAVFPLVFWLMTMGPTRDSCPRKGQLVVSNNNIAVASPLYTNFEIQTICSPKHTAQHWPYPKLLQIIPHFHIVIAFLLVSSKAIDCWYNIFHLFVINLSVKNGSQFKQMLRGIDNVNWTFVGNNNSPNWPENIKRDIYRQNFYFHIVN